MHTEQLRFWDVASLLITVNYLICIQEDSTYLAMENQNNTKLSDNKQMQMNCFICRDFVLVLPYFIYLKVKYLLFTSYIILHS